LSSNSEFQNKVLRLPKTKKNPIPSVTESELDPK